MASGGPEAPDTVQQRRRTFNACVRCKSHKARCDGGMPRCSACHQANASCRYVERKTRGPGKSKQHIKQLEERLRGVESVLKGVAPSAAPGAHNEGHSADGDTNPTEPPLADAYFPSRAVMLSVQPRQDGGCLAERVYVPLRMAATSSRFLAASLEVVGSYWPIFEVEPVVALLVEQREAGLENSSQDPSRWALMNALFALGIQWKTASGATEDLFPISWAYFKNAFAMLPQLLIRGKDIMACEAVVAMAMFMQGTGDAQAASGLISTAAHMQRVLGMQQAEFYTDLKPREAERHRRVSWITLMIRIDITMKGGPPSGLLDYTEVRLPSDSAEDRTALPGAPLLRYMAALTVIQSCILRQVCFARGLSKDVSTSLQAIAELDCRLEQWRASIPAPFRPMESTTIEDSELEIGFIHLHLMYHSTVWDMRSAWKICKTSAAAELDPVKVAALEAKLSSFSWLSPTDLQTAQAVLLTAVEAKSQPSYPQLWQTLTSAFTAALMVVAEVLEKPSRPGVQSSVDLLGRFASYLRRLGSIGKYDLESISSAAARLQAFATHATSPCRAALLSDGSEDVDLGLVGFNEQCKQFRAGLDEAGDLSHISYGLMSNMPQPHKLAMRLFSDTFGEASRAPEDGFGPLVPDALRPDHYNFVFGES